MASTSTAPSAAPNGGPPAVVPQNTQQFEQMHTLAAMIREREDLRQDAKSCAASFKDQIEKLDTSISRLAREIESGQGRLFASAEEAIESLDGKEIKVGDTTATITVPKSNTKGKHDEARA